MWLMLTSFCYIDIFFLNGDELLLDVCYKVTNDILIFNSVVRLFWKRLTASSLFQLWTQNVLFPLTFLSRFHVDENKKIVWSVSFHSHILSYLQGCCQVYGVYIIIRFITFYCYLFLWLVTMIIEQLASSLSVPESKYKQSVAVIVTFIWLKVDCIASAKENLWFDASLTIAG